MSEIKIHIFHIGKVCVAPELPFGGEHYSALKASGVLDRQIRSLGSLPLYFTNQVVVESGAAIGTRCCSRILTATTRTASSRSRTQKKFSF